MPASVQHGAQWSFTAIGVPWSIETADQLDAVLKQRIAERIERFDRTYSRFRSDSLVTKIATIAGSYRLPADAAKLMTIYRRLYELTSGAVSPLVGQRLENLGYDRAYSLTPQAHRVEVPRWEEAISWDGERLVTANPVVFDIGAAGKGYLVDLVAGILDDAGIARYLIDASGDLLHRGDEPVAVGLEHPFDPTLAIGVYQLSNGALCASAPNRRSWGKGLHHIIDAVTGEPTMDVAATWAAASTALVADGLATALFFGDADGLEAEFGIEYVRMFPDGRVAHSSAFSGSLFLAAPVVPGELMNDEAVPA